MEKGNVLNLKLKMLKLIILLFILLETCDFGKERISPSDIRVEVLNATGELHLARIISMELRRNGFDVIRFSNADDTLSKTVIIERKSPDKKYAKILANVIGVNRIDFEPDPQRICEVTLIIGKDYKKVFKNNLFLWK